MEGEALQSLGRFAGDQKTRTRGAPVDPDDTRTRSSSYYSFEVGRVPASGRNSWKADRSTEEAEGSARRLVGDLTFPSPEADPVTGGVVLALWRSDWRGSGEIPVSCGTKGSSHASPAEDIERTSTNAGSLGAAPRKVTSLTGSTPTAR